MNQTRIGIEIGGTKLQVVLGDSKGRILWKIRHQIQARDGAAAIRRQILISLKSFSSFSISGIGIGFGGPVDIKKGSIFCSHHVAGWDGFPLQKWLEKLTRVPVLVENDAKVAALGEARLGAGRGYPSSFYVTLGSGMGGGLVTNQEIFHGRTPGECEIGHLRIKDSGEILEHQVSGWAVNRKVRTAARKHPRSALAHYARLYPGCEARALLPALKQSDPRARAILQLTASQIAWGLSHVVHLLHPHILILGGGLTHLGSPLVTSVRKYLRPLVMKSFQPCPQVVLSSLKEDVVPVGALLLGTQKK